MRYLFALRSPPEIVRAYFGYDERPEFPPRDEIAPTQPISIVVSRPFTRGEERSHRLVRWGFLPGFVKNPQDFPLIANARAENLLDKPSFAPAFRRRRCLAPADGFYAWRPAARGQAREPCIAEARGGAPFGFAALYETYLDPNGSEIDTACLITTNANALMSEVGERMPVILDRAAFSAWLDHETTPLHAAWSLLRPAPEALLRLAPLSGAHETPVEQPPILPR